MNSPPSEIIVRVLFFAHARELAGTSATTLTLTSPTTPQQALALLVASYPSLSPLAAHCALAVNLEYCTVYADPLAHDDELAVIPPISGG